MIYVYVLTWIMNYDVGGRRYVGDFGVRVLCTCLYDV